MSRIPPIISIVEGPGERQAVPLLLRRLLQEVFERYDVTVTNPIVTHGKGNMDRRLERYLEYARIQEAGGVIVVRDADRDCPHAIARGMAARAGRMNLGVPVVVVCPKPEFEAWIIGSLAGSCGESIRGLLGIRPATAVPNDVEILGDAKGWLSGCMPADKIYKPTTHQAKLAARISIGQASTTCRSFRRFLHAVEELVEAMDTQITNRVTPE